MQAAQEAQSQAAAVTGSAGSEQHAQTVSTDSNVNKNYVANLHVGPGPAASQQPSTKCTTSTEQRDAQGRLITTTTTEETAGVDEHGVSTSCVKKTVTQHQTAVAPRFLEVTSVPEQQQATSAPQSANTTTAAPVVPSVLPPLLQHEEYSYTRTKDREVDGQTATMTTKVTITPRGGLLALPLDTS